MKIKIIALIALAIGILVGFYTPDPKYCLQYFDGIKPVYNLNCILEEANRLAPNH